MRTNEYKPAGVDERVCSCECAENLSCINHFEDVLITMTEMIICFCADYARRKIAKFQVSSRNPNCVYSIRNYNNTATGDSRTNGMFHPQETREIFILDSFKFQDASADDIPATYLRAGKIIALAPGFMGSMRATLNLVVELISSSSS